jgi:hypothetical protein
LHAGIHQSNGLQKIKQKYEENQPETDPAVQKKYKRATLIAFTISIISGESETAKPVE